MAINVREAAEMQESNMTMPPIVPIPGVPPIIGTPGPTPAPAPSPSNIIAEVKAMLAKLEAMLVSGVHTVEGTSLWTKIRGHLVMFLIILAAGVFGALLMHYRHHASVSVPMGLLTAPAAQVERTAACSSLDARLAAIEAKLTPAAAPILPAPTVPVVAPVRRKAAATGMFGQSR